MRPRHDEAKHKLQSTKDWMSICGDDICMDMVYPSYNGNEGVRIGLMTVRAADDIRISYDFKRDGWKVEQARFHKWASGDKVCDPCWTEVGFFEAWALEEADV